VGDDSGGAQRVDRGAEEAGPEVGEYVAELVAVELGDGFPEVEDGLLDEEPVPGGVLGDVVEEGVLLGGRETLGDRQTASLVMSLG
jgi:hypothetical protein